MEKEKTTLQRIVEQKAEQIRNAIEQAINEGAKIEKEVSYSTYYECCRIDGLYLQKSASDGSISVILNVRSEKIEKAFGPTREYLEKLAAQKRAELEDIEKQIKFV